jgi:HK97 family phage portal protein
MRDLLSTVLGGARTLRNEVPVPFTSARGGMGGDAGGALDAQSAYDAYGSVGTLFAIVSQIGNAVARVEWHLYQKTSVRDKKRRKEIPNHPFLDVWNMPNPFYTGRFFRETVQQHLDLVGEGFIVLYRTGNMILEMWPVRPDRMAPVTHPTKYQTGWMYKGPDGEEVPLPLEDVIHLKYPNPGNPFRGMGAVGSVLNDIRAAQYAAKWNENFFVNGARPGGIIKVDYRMGDKEWKQFTNRWREQHQGVANAHRVAVLENAEWVDTNFSMSDMQFVELRNLPRELIREAFAFPKPMLGTVDDVNRANAQAGKEIMADNQATPRLDRWKDIVNVFLLPQFANGKNLAIDYENPTPANAEDEDRRLTAQTTAYRNMILAGAHPDDAALVCGLPATRWVGIPAPNMPGANPEKDEETAIANRVKGTLERRMPVIDWDGGEWEWDDAELVSSGTTQGY